METATAQSLKIGKNLTARLEFVKRSCAESCSKNYDSKGIFRSNLQCMSCMSKVVFVAKHCSQCFSVDASGIIGKVSACTDSCTAAKKDKTKTKLDELKARLGNRLKSMKDKFRHVKDPEEMGNL